MEILEVGVKFCNLQIIKVRLTLLSLPLKCFLSFKSNNLFLLVEVWYYLFVGLMPSTVVSSFVS